MAAGPNTPDSSDAPQYTPTDLISPRVVFAPPYTEIAAHDPTGTNETATADAPVANETPKPRRRRRENCPLSSHSWVLWVIWLYCSAFFSVEVVELLCLWPPLLSPVWIWIRWQALCLITWWLTWKDFSDLSSDWNSWPEDSERYRLRLQYKQSLAFTYLNTVVTGLAVALYVPFMLWNHYFIHYPGKYEVLSIFGDTFFAAYYLGFAPIRVETYLWFSVPLM